MLILNRTALSPYAEGMELLPSWYRRGYFLASVFILALAIRGIFAFGFEHALSPDSPSWINPAIDLINGRGFTGIRHPGYIMFLASVFKVAGEGNLTAVRFAQILLSSAQVLLIFILARNIFKKESIACLSALFLAFYPYAVFQASEIMSESFNSFLLVFFFVLLYEVLEHKRKTLFAALSGIAFTLTILTKSNIVVILPFIYAFFHLNGIRKNFLMFLMAAATAILPWTVHNYKQYDKFVLVSLSGMALFHANNAMTLTLEHETRQLKEINWFTPECLEIAKLPPVEADKEFRRRAWQFMRSNPETVFHLMKVRFVHFWRLYPITHSKVQRMAALLSSGIFIPLALLGMLLSLNCWKKTFPIWAAIFSYNLIHLFFLSMLRYRIPLDPFFLIFASFTFITGLELFKNKKTVSP